jgi:hypothetical protein
MVLINANVKCKKSFIMKRPKDILSQPYHIQEYINDLERKNSYLHSVSESYIKCWNCKQFEQTGTNTMGNEVGNCKLNDCKVSHPKWQKCGEYEQCGNFR